MPIYVNEQSHRALVTPGLVGVTVVWQDSRSPSLYLPILSEFFFFYNRHVLFIEPEITHRKLFSCRVEWRRVSWHADLVSQETGLPCKDSDGNLGILCASHPLWLLPFVSGGNLQALSAHAPAPGISPVPCRSLGQLAPFMVIPVFGNLLY